VHLNLVGVDCCSRNIVFFCASDIQLVIIVRAFCPCCDYTFNRLVVIHLLSVVSHFFAFDQCVMSISKLTWTVFSGWMGNQRNPIYPMFIQKKIRLQFLFSPTFLHLCFFCSLDGKIIFTWNMGCSCLMCTKNSA
jgi:hypothetical protein